MVTRETEKVRQEKGNRDTDINALERSVRDCQRKDRSDKEIMIEEKKYQASAGDTNRGKKSDRRRDN